jgi:hypothetical protein
MSKGLLLSLRVCVCASSPLMGFWVAVLLACWFLLARVKPSPRERGNPVRFGPLFQCVLSESSLIA